MAANWARSFIVAPFPEGPAVPFPVLIQFPVRVGQGAVKAQVKRFGAFVSVAVVSIHVRDAMGTIIPYHGTPGIANLDLELNRKGDDFTLLDLVPMPLADAIRKDHDILNGLGHWSPPVFQVRRAFRHADDRRLR
jgi:hypothetical protein